MIEAKLLYDFMHEFYGYGSYSGDIWFVGMEEGGGDKIEEIKRRLEAWTSRGRRELEDLASYHFEIGFPEYFIDPPKNQRTWNKLIRFLLSAKRENPDLKSVKQYQKERLGQKTGDSCLLELFPLPSPTTGSWLYNEYSDIPFLRNRKLYKCEIVGYRILHLQRKIRKHQPKAVIFYSMNNQYMKWWQQIACIKFEPMEFDNRKAFIGRNKATKTGPLCNCSWV